VIPEKVTQPKKGVRDVSGDEITNETIEEAGRIVAETDNYGPEMEMITRCLRRFPDNTDPDIVAMKVGLIDITNSAHLSQHKSKISMVELSNIIASILDIDARIKAGDPEVVNQIAKSNGKINLFSFVRSQNYLDTDSIVENNFRVLLTRARKEMIILIPRDSMLDETYQYFVDMGMDEL